MSTSAGGSWKSSGEPARPTCKRAAAPFCRTRTSRLAGTTSGHGSRRATSSRSSRSKTARPIRNTSRPRRPSNITGASATGWARSARRAHATKPSCSSRRRPAAPSARSSWPPTTRSARATSRRPTTSRPRGLLVATGQLSRGFHLPDGRLTLFAEADLFEEERRVHERRRSATSQFLSDFRDLKTGDLVVHIDNGVGRFVGSQEAGHRRAGRARQSRRAGVHGAPLCRRRQAVRSARTPRSRPEVHRWREPRARSARRHDVGEGQDPREEGHARHGRRAAQALRRAQGRRRARVQRRRRTGSRSSTTRSSTT